MSETATAVTGTAPAKDSWYWALIKWVGRAAISIPGRGATAIWGTMNVFASAALCIWSLKYFYGVKFLALIGLASADTAFDTLAASPSVRWIAAAYLVVQGISLISMDISKVIVLAMDIGTSLLPAAVIGFAAVDRMLGGHYTHLSPSRVEDLSFMLMIVFIDFVIFGMAGLKLNRRYLGDVMGGQQTH